MKKFSLVFIILSLVLSLTSCGGELSGIEIFEKATKAFNNLDSATVVVNATNKTKEASIGRTDTIKFNFSSGKRISLTESYMQENPETIDKTYIDHKSKKFYKTNYEGVFETFDATRLSSLALSNSNTIYWAQINKNTVESQNIEKNENGYNVTFVLKQDALKKYMDSFGMGDVPLASIKLTLKTDSNFIPISIECYYMRINEIENEFSEIEVVDLLEFKNINSTEKLVEPTV